MAASEDASRSGADYPGRPCEEARRGRGRAGHGGGERGMQRSLVAALLVCHNRREETLACLEALSGQLLDGQVETHAYVVDAGSTDGTAEAIRERFPRASLILRSP